jgi:hypothetical protein
MNPSPVNLELDPSTVDDDNSDSLKFNSNPLTCTEISDAIFQLKDKMSQDENGISSHFIKKIALSVSKPLLFIFSNSFRTGSIPNTLKTAKIIPLFKSVRTIIGQLPY